ncbi:MAG: hypothetical protein AAGP08_11905 [Pseudomonadota bacterium]
MNPELYFDYLLFDPASKVVGESTASQLPGRQNGGAADAYRHILLSAELTRDYGAATAFEILIDHERDALSGADNGLDMWNNDIGMKTGQYVRDSDGDWSDVVRLARSVMVGSFDQSLDYRQVANWPVQNASAGISIAYEEYVRHHSATFNGPDSIDPYYPPQTLEDFSAQFNQTYQFRGDLGPIIFENGALVVSSAAMTSPSNWSVHPKVFVNGHRIELTVDQSEFPTPSCFEGSDFVYEAGNSTPRIFFDPSDLSIVQECFHRSAEVATWNNCDEIGAKVISKIAKGDMVVDYDYTGELVHGLVTRTFQSIATTILDVHGLMVTPGHVTFCGEGRFAESVR